MYTADAPRPFLYSDIQGQIARLRELATFALPASIVTSGDYEIFRFKTYLVLEEPRSSLLALIVNFFLSLCIIGSTVVFAIESVPSEEHYQSIWWNFEIFFVAVFISEYLVRLWARRVSLLVFLTRPMNVIDLLAVLPFFLELTIIYTGGLLDMRFLRSVRLLRLFKFGRHSTQLQLIIGGLKKSVWPLALVFLMLTLALVMFGTAMFMVERGTWDSTLQCYVRPDNQCSPFESIPKSFWWGIATLTTVGYGDVYPITVGGRLVAAVAMVAGIICVALPTTVLGVQFSEAYGDLKAQMEMEGLRNATTGNAAALYTKKPSDSATRAAEAAARLVSALDALNSIKKDLELVLPTVRSDLLVLANPDASQLVDEIDEDGEPMGAADLASKALAKKVGSMDAVVERSIAVLGANSINSIQSYISFILSTTEEYFTINQS